MLHYSYNITYCRELILYFLRYLNNNLLCGPLPPINPAGTINVEGNHWDCPLPSWCTSGKCDGEIPGPTCENTPFGICSPINVPQKQIDALQDFYDNTNSAVWDPLGTWDFLETPLAPCSGTWIGISCASGLVTSLDLPNKGIVGKFVPSFSYLVDLQFMYVHSF